MERSPKMTCSSVKQIDLYIPNPFLNWHKKFSFSFTVARAEFFDYASCIGGLGEGMNGVLNSTAVPNLSVSTQAEYQIGSKVSDFHVSLRSTKSVPSTNGDLFCISCVLSLLFEMDVDRSTISRFYHLSLKNMKFVGETLNSRTNLWNAHVHQVNSLTKVTFGSVSQTPNVSRIYMVNQEARDVCCPT
jgi:hypothetical protein